MGKYRDLNLALSPDAFLRLGEASGSTAVDETGAHSGTIVGSPTLLTPGLLVEDSNAAMSFAAAPTITVASLPAWGAGTGFTVKMLIKPSTTSLDRGLFSRPGTTANQTAGYLGNDQFLHFFGATGSVGCVSTVKIIDTLPHHVAFVNDGSTSGWFIYLDGVNVSGTVTNGTITANSATLTLGVDLASDFWNGVMDEVFVKAGALTAAQVMADYQASRTGDPFFVRQPNAFHHPASGPFYPLAKPDWLDVTTPRIGYAHSQVVMAA